MESNAQTSNWRSNKTVIQTLLGFLNFAHCLSFSFLLPLLPRGCSHLECSTENEVVKTLLVTGIVSSYYLGYGIGITIFPRLFALVSRKTLIVVCTIFQGLFIAGLSLSNNMFIVLVLRFLSGLCGTVDIVFKELIDDVSIQTNRSCHIVALLLSPRAFSMAAGCLLTSFLLSHNLKLCGDRVLSLPAISISALLLLLALLTIILISSTAINLRKTVFTYVEFEGAAREASTTKTAHAPIKEVKLELYENMVSSTKVKTESKREQNNGNEAAELKKNATQGDPAPQNGREFNIEVLLSENQLDDVPEAPKNLTFRSMLSSGLGGLPGKEGDESMSLSREKARAKDEFEGRASVVTQKLVPEKDSSPIETPFKSEPKPPAEELPAVKTVEARFTREKVALIILTIQDSAIGDLWPVWLGVCIGSVKAEAYIGLVLATAYAALLLMQTAALCKLRSILLKVVYSRILLISMAPIYIVVSLLPSTSSCLKCTLLAFFAVCFCERFAMFAANSFAMNQLPKNSQGLFKLRYLVRFAVYVVAALALGRDVSGKLLFCLFAVLTIVSALLLKNETLAKGVPVSAKQLPKDDGEENTKNDKPNA